MIYIKLGEILAIIYSDILSSPSSFWDSLGDHVGTLDGGPTGLRGPLPSSSFFSFCPLGWEISTDRSASLPILLCSILLCSLSSAVELLVNFSFQLLNVSTPEFLLCSLL